LTNQSLNQQDGGGKNALKKKGGGDPMEALKIMRRKDGKKEGLAGMKKENN